MSLVYNKQGGLTITAKIVFLIYQKEQATALELSTHFSNSTSGNVSAKLSELQNRGYVASVYKERIRKTWYLTSLGKAWVYSNIHDVQKRFGSLDAAIKLGS